MRAESADGAFFDGDEHLMLAGEPFDEIRIERLDEARIGNRRR